MKLKHTLAVIGTLAVFLSCNYTKEAAVKEVASAYLSAIVSNDTLAQDSLVVPILRDFLRFQGRSNLPQDLSRQFEILSVRWLAPDSAQVEAWSGDVGIRLKVVRIENEWKIGLSPEAAESLKTLDSLLQSTPSPTKSFKL